MLALYFLAISVAYLFRDNTFRLVTFGSCAAHYVASRRLAVSSAALAYREGR